MIEEGFSEEGETILCTDKPQDIARALSGVESCSLERNNRKRIRGPYAANLSIRSAIDHAFCRAFSEVADSCGADEYRTSHILGTAAERWYKMSCIRDNAIRRLREKNARKKACVFSNKKAG